MIDKLRGNGGKFLLSGLVFAGLLLSPLAAHAQSVSKRLEIIEKQLKAVQRKVFDPSSQFPREAAPSGAAQQSMATGGNLQLADMEARIAQIETQLRQLTGRIEEGNFQVEQMKQQMDTMAQDYEFRLAELERGKGGTSNTSAGPTAASTPPSIPKTSADILPAGTVEDQYSYAQKLVTVGQYADGEIALTEFLKRYPKDDLAGNAQYWLGQTYYVRKMYTQATRAFLEGYNNYPKSPKAPAFLLKIGMSLNAMGEKTDACDAYRELASRFPNSLESKNTRPSEERRAGCS